MSVSDVVATIAALTFCLVLRVRFERRLFGGVQERAVTECVPSLGLRRVDRVPGQRAGQPFRRAVVKEDEHR